MAERDTILSWSSGKDSAWALQTLSVEAGLRVCALLTTFNETMDRVAMHAVRRSLVRRQAESIGLPLVEVPLPWPCSNAEYEQAFATAASQTAERYGADRIAFGDLFLTDIRKYRERQVGELGLTPVFPLWQQPTTELAATMIDAGLHAVVTCVDPGQLDKEFVGRAFNRAFLDDLPDDVDPCGENGEFHTFVWDGPGFSVPVPITVGDIVARDGFWFADIVER
jgi:uncharacterized protein (TIGR00290 family)